MSDNKDWKPYTVPYTGSGAIHTRHGSGVAQSPSGQIFSSSPPPSGFSRGPQSHTRPNQTQVRPSGAENQGPQVQAQAQANLNLPAGTFTRLPDRPKSAATLQREAVQVRKSCSGQGGGGRDDLTSSE
ncbi:hypothetical protein MGN70_010562 [Eutypa lata]|nr:hypothetical protein MGN70_010562 [Eutypa lata]